MQERRARRGSRGLSRLRRSRLEDRAPGHQRQAEPAANAAPPTPSSWLDRRRNSRGEPLRPLTRRQVHILAARPRLPTFGGLPLDQISRPDVRSWHDGLTVGPSAGAHASRRCGPSSTQRSSTTAARAQPGLHPRRRRPPQEEQSLKPASLDELEVMVGADARAQESSCSPGHLVRPAVRGLRELRRSDVTLGRDQTALPSGGSTSPEGWCEQDRRDHARADGPRAHGRGSQDRRGHAHDLRPRVPPSHHPGASAAAPGPRRRTACSSRPTAMRRPPLRSDLERSAVRSTWTGASSGSDSDGARPVAAPNDRTWTCTTSDARGEPGRRRGRQHGQLCVASDTAASDGHALSAQPPRAAHWASGSPRVPCERIVKDHRESLLSPASGSRILCEQGYDVPRGSGGCRLSRADPLEPRPPGPASLLDQPHQPPATGTGSRNIESSRSTSSSGISSRRLSHPSSAASSGPRVGRSRPQPRVVGLPVDHVVEVAVELDAWPGPRAAALVAMYIAIFSGSCAATRIQASRSPSIIRSGRPSRAAGPGTRRVGRQGQAVAGGELAIRSRCCCCSRISARSRRSISATAAANSSSSAASSSCTRDSGTPASARVRILIRLDDGVGVVPPVAGGVALRLRQQPLGVVVPHRAHGDAGVRRELADREHRPSVPLLRRDPGEQATRPEVAEQRDQQAPAERQPQVAPGSTRRGQARRLSIIGVNGWCSAKWRSPAGIASVGTKPLLRNGSITGTAGCCSPSRRCRRPAPSRR